MNIRPDTVASDVARQAVQNMARRVALLHMAYARVLVDELGEGRGRELIGAAILRYGTMIGKRARDQVVQQGFEPTPENMHRGSDLSPLGFDGSAEVVGGEDRSRVLGCPMAEVWDEYGENDLGVLYCQVDPAKMQAYDPSWTMVHTRQVPKGDEFCEIAVRPAATGE